MDDLFLQHALQVKKTCLETQTTAAVSGCRKLLRHFRATWLPGEQANGDSSSHDLPGATWVIPDHRELRADCDTRSYLLSIVGAEDPLASPGSSVI